MRHITKCIQIMICDGNLSCLFKYLRHVTFIYAFNISLFVVYVKQLDFYFVRQMFAQEIENICSNLCGVINPQPNCDFRFFTQSTRVTKGVKKNSLIFWCHKISREKFMKFDVTWTSRFYDGVINKSECLWCVIGLKHISVIYYL